MGLRNGATLADCTNTREKGLSSLVVATGPCRQCDNTKILVELVGVVTAMAVIKVLPVLHYTNETTTHSTTATAAAAAAAAPQPLLATFASSLCRTAAGAQTPAENP